MGPRANRRAPGRGGVNGAKCRICTERGSCCRSNCRQRGFIGGSLTAGSPFCPFLGPFGGNWNEALEPNGLSADTRRNSLPMFGNLALCVHVDPRSPQTLWVSEATEEETMKVIRVTTCGLALAVLCLSLVPMASAADKPVALGQKGIENVQKTLSDRGFYKGSIDGIIGPQTRAGLREYQSAEGLAVTGRLDEKTAGKLGVGPESVGGNFKEAGQDVGQGGKDMGHEMKNGKPVAAGQEFGKEVGKAGEKVGSGVKKAVTPDKDK